MHLGKKKEWFEKWTFYPFYGRVGMIHSKRSYMKATTLIGLVGVTHEKKLMTVVFRGSQLFHDWLHTLNLTLRKAPSLLRMKGFFTEGI